MHLRNRQHKNEKGNIMLITTIVILILTIIVATCINVSAMQFNLSILGRNTSNTYYLAESAIEKEIDGINKSIETKLSYMADQIGEQYIKQMTNIPGTEDPIATATTAQKIATLNDDTKRGKMYENLVYKEMHSGDTDILFRVDSSELQRDIKEKIYEYICDHYVDKPITYEVESDRVAAGYKTEMTITVKKLTPEPADKDQFSIIATARTTNGTEIYDVQTVESIFQIEVPADVKNQFREKYEWTFHAPELLDEPLTCFSDVVISDEGKLVVNGNMLVKGDKKTTDLVAKAVAGAGIDRTTSQFPDPDQSGGVIAINDGKIEVNGNLYCDSNVMVTNGWHGTRGSGGSIEVTGDVIANTIGIVDDFYDQSLNQSPYATGGQVTNASITIHQNAMVDNDVMIDRWVNGCNITVDGVIFGVSGGTGVEQTINGELIADPNKSSGVFSQGENSQIIATKGIFVNGQPYITIGTGRLPMRLHESVGEPFNGVASWEGYVTEDETNPKNKEYLLEGSPFYGMIKRKQVKTNVDNTYAPAMVSAEAFVADADGKFETTKERKAIFGADQAEANDFFFNGGTSKTISDFSGLGDYSQSASLLTNDTITKFYSGDTSLCDKPWAYNKIIGSVGNNYRGLSGYMTARRSVFYKKFDSDSLVRATFSEVVRSTWPDKQDWSYKDPILVMDDTSANMTVDLGQFYVDEGDGTAVAWPTIIVNKGDNDLVIKAKEGNTFKGVIISAGKGKVVFDSSDGNMTINGSVIIRGPESSLNERDKIMKGDNSGLKIIGTNTVTLNGDSDMLLKIKTDNNMAYRKILDALKITQFTGNTAIETALDKYHDSDVSYAVSKVIISKDSYLEIDTDDIMLSIKQTFRVD